MASHQGTDAEVRQTLAAAPRTKAGGTAPGKPRPARNAAAAANHDTFTPPLKLPPLLALDQGATRVPRAHEHLKRDELWQGHAYPVQADGSPAPGAEHAVYFRLAEGSFLAAELLGALLALSAGLPTPQPYVLRIDAGMLEGSRFRPGAATQPLLCVATHDMGGASFAQLLAEHSDSARALLRQWHALLPATAFDEWIANPDRNFGNLLFVARELWLIDHADAFGGPQRELLDLHELVDKRLTNKLAILLGRDTPTQRRDHLAAAHRWLSATAASLNLADLARHTRHWQNEAQAHALVQFLAQRLRITHRLLCERLGYPQLALQ